ncbi:MAG: hypothetical protein QOD51_2604 [Candidatus Eremiobacteraeota bacterium]|nr:hypothetical protein [Candidatus Eremiobacteraeota bacterium]
MAADDLVVKSCREISGGGAERGLATFRFRYEISGGKRAGAARYTGKVTFSLGDVVIMLPKSIAWRGMTDKDRERAEALRRAILHHEVGHVRVAEAVRDQLNAHPPIDAPDSFAFGSAADAIGRDGFERFRTEGREYDALTDHGRRQHLAPDALAGPDTILFCP